MATAREEKEQAPTPRVDSVKVKDQGCDDAERGQLRLAARSGKPTSMMKEWCNAAWGTPLTHSHHLSRWARKALPHARTAPKLAPMTKGSIRGRLGAGRRKGAFSSPAGNQIWKQRNVAVNVTTHLPNHSPQDQ